MPVAATAASATGISERARRSNSSNSIASSTDETGAEKIAAMPAAAPAANSTLRSSALTRSTWPSREPSAPPVAMIGPSAPNGPPVPMATAEDTGFSQVTRGGMRLSLRRICSIASGMPWPRIAVEPQRAMTPTTSPPATGTKIVHAPQCVMPGATKAVLQRP